jgi:hypothetical protein
MVSTIRVLVADRIRNALSYLIVINAYFPWVSFNMNSLESQPWAALLAAIYVSLFWRHIYLSNQVKWYAALLLVGLFVSTFLGHPQELTTFIRYYGGYISLLLMSVACVDIFIRNGLSLYVMILCNTVWITFGLVQVIYPEVIDLFLINRSTITRGVTSLAPEPSLFGISLLIFCLHYFMAWHDTKHVRYLLLILFNFFAILFLAQSAYVTSLVLMMSVIAIMFNVKNVLGALKAIGVGWVFIGVCILTVSISLDEIPDNVSNSRIFYIFMRMSVGDISDLVHYDESINLRVQSFIFPLYLSLLDFLLPHGPENFLSLYLQSNGILDSMRALHLLSSDKIMSWLGAIVFELGIFGVAAIFAFLFRNFSTREGILELLLFIPVVAGPISISTSLIPLLLSTLYLRGRFPPVEGGEYSILFDRRATGIRRGIVT